LQENIYVNKKSAFVHFGTTVRENSALVISIYKELIALIKVNGEEIAEALAALG